MNRRMNHRMSRRMNHRMNCRMSFQADESAERVLKWLPLWTSYLPSKDSASRPTPASLHRAMAVLLSSISRPQWNLR